MGYSPQGRKESNTTEVTEHARKVEAYSPSTHCSPRQSPGSREAGRQQELVPMGTQDGPSGDAVEGAGLEKSNPPTSDCRINPRYVCGPSAALWPCSPSCLCLGVVP